MNSDLPGPIAQAVRDDVARALSEDVGEGDRTALLVPGAARALARVVAREEAVVCGGPWFEQAFRVLDPPVRFEWHVAEGARCVPGQAVVVFEGPARALVTGERTALNFLQLLSGVATKTARFVEAVRGTRAAILDTRKTIPGLRAAQKYAVRTGGGANHRMGLYDAILVKENHIAAAGGVIQALAAVAPAARGAGFVQIEVETLDQLEEAIAAGAHMVLLDNMELAQVREAVRRAAGRVLLEVSGGVTLDRVREVALTGVDRISVGSLTKDVHAVDFSMRIEAV